MLPKKIQLLLSLSPTTAVKVVGFIHCTMKSSKFTPADRKAIALAAYLFYAERDYDTQLLAQEHELHWELRVTYEDARQLEDCPLLHQPFISNEIVRVGYSDMVSIWYLPIQSSTL